ncbi:MAG: TrkH family potassium uptake protein [Bacilli bacterium]|nr:TrkH family potassium uptake protein [Bacilli bacterium]
MGDTNINTNVNTPSNSARLVALPSVRGWRLFLGYIGAFLIFVGFLILVPLIIIAFHPEEADVYPWFLIPGASSIVLGVGLYALIFKRRRARLQKWESYLLLLSVWIVAIIVGAIPYRLSGYLNFSQSVFESASGFTTTAISVIDTEDSLALCGYVFQFFRCWMLFVGGIGLTLIITSAISDANGLSLYNLEGHNDRLLPNVVKSARIIFLIYFVYIIIGVCAYVACGMPVFDAVCNSISSLSTGGYSLHASGIAYYNSIGIEIITCILMLLGATNFMIHFAIMRAKFKHFFYHCELYCALIMAILFLPPIIIGCNYVLQDVASKYPGSAYLSNPAYSIRYGVFMFISTVTSTGFTNTPPEAYLQFESLPSFAYIAIFLCMVIGGQAGSTAGGVKQIRVVQIFKQAYWYIRGSIDNSHIIHSRTIIRYGKKEAISDDELHNAASFILIYIAIVLLGAFALTCCSVDYTFDVALFQFTSFFTNSGVAAGAVTLTTPLGVYWITIIGMVIGRLEPIIFMLLLARGLKSASEKAKKNFIISKLRK